MKSYVIVGLGFGDEGKGSIVDALVRKTGAQLVVRYNGGPQAAHNVVESSGRHHTFAQFGSGTLAGAKTFLSRFMLIDPLALANEEHTLQRVGVGDAYDRLYVDARATVITPYHQAINRTREKARGHARHGSCGMGIGEAVQDSLNRPDGIIQISDFHDRDLLDSKLAATYETMEEIGREMGAGCAELHRTPSVFSLSAQYRRIANQLNVVLTDSDAIEILRSHDSILEGAQGVLLDQDYGFHPYTTWSSTTTANALTLLREADITDVKTVGVVRAYMTRHGAGPFVTEDSLLKFEDKYNRTGEWQGNFRLGYFDFPSLRYALLANRGVDYLAVTHLDQIHRHWHYCDRYQNDPLVESPRTISDQEQITRQLYGAKPIRHFAPADMILEIIEEQLAIPVGITSAGPCAEHKRFKAQHQPITQPQLTAALQESADRHEIALEVQSPAEFFEAHGFWPDGYNPDLVGARNVAKLGRGEPRE